MALKSVVDKFCFNGVLDDTDPDVKNLLIILENILMHRLKPKGTSAWFSDEVASYWPRLVSSCSKVRRSCIPSIIGMGSHLTGLALGRIFLQVALMERRLSEYLSELVSPDSVDLLRKAYEPEAFLLKEEGTALSHICLGLNAIDFSFCPKGENLDYQYIPCIDFTPYLDFTPCVQAELDDEHEQAVLNGSLQASPSGKTSPADENWRGKFQTLYVKYRELGQQKSYAEDMLTLKQARIEKLEFDLASVQGDVERIDSEHAREINQLQSVVAELQAELQSCGREKSTTDRRRLEGFLTGLSRNGKFHEAIALKEMWEVDATPSLSGANVETDVVSLEDDFQRSPYGSVDGLERLMQAGGAVDPNTCNDSLRPLRGSISASSQQDNPL